MAKAKTPQKKKAPLPQTAQVQPGKAGRPFGSFKLSPEAVERAWEEYMVHCESFMRYQVSAGKVVPVPTPIIYTVEDFCTFAGIDDDTFNEYGKLADYSATIKKVRKAIFARKQRAMVNGEGNVAGLS